MGVSSLILGSAIVILIVFSITFGVVWLLDMKKTKKLRRNIPEEVKEQILKEKEEELRSMKKNKSKEENVSKDKKK